MLVLNFYSPVFIDQLRRGRKSATIRLGDKSHKYRKGEVVLVTVGYQHSPRERIFEAVVRPERARVDGADASAEIERLTREVERAEKMLANERFVANAPAEVVEAEREKLERYRSELEALTR